MKWIAISFFSIVIVLSVLFTAGFEFIAMDLDTPTTAQAPPAATP